VILKRWQAKTGSPEETRVLGRLIGELAGTGLVILLNGDLGSGKTCFAQGVAVGLGIPIDAPITSPSYTLLNVHQGRLPLYHFDLYRLSQVDDLADLGYDEIAEGDGLTLVEWADRMNSALAASITVHLQPHNVTQRLLRFEALDARGLKILQQLAEQWDS
jgi:tRNA threonylcarbamoyladenosine biosynthesis protein TsaE